MELAVYKGLMDIRIQQALDGEIPRRDLSSDEAAQLGEAEALFQRVLGSIRTEPLPDLSKAVLARLPEPPADREVERESPLDIIRGALSWLWNPRAIALRPAYALGAAALLAVVMLFSRAPTPPLVTQAPQVFVQFRFDAPQAQQVALAGDFTAWKPAHQLVRSEGGTWTIVVAINPGVHEYAFIVDGERWLPDPAAPAIEDGFGGMNSRLAVLAPDARAM